MPIPVFESFEALNAHLMDCCRKRLATVCAAMTETIGERLERDLAAFQTPLPAPYDACEKKPGRVTSLSLVRYRLQRLLGADGLRAPEGAGPRLRA